MRQIKACRAVFPFSLFSLESRVPLSFPLLFPSSGLKQWKGGMRARAPFFPPPPLRFFPNLQGSPHLDFFFFPLRTRLQEIKREHLMRPPPLPSPPLPHTSSLPSPSHRRNRVENPPFFLHPSTPFFFYLSPPIVVTTAKNNGNRVHPPPLSPPFPCLTLPFPPLFRGK